jgi:hypothetical protein
MFKNRIRLPFYVTRPQFPTEQNVFRLANGRTKTASVIIKKTFDGETENLPAEIHERLIIAMKHDDVTIEGYRYLGGVSLESDYEIEWNRFLDYPLGKAEFKVQVTPYNYSNDNCQTCEEASQVVCHDDDIGTLNENTDYNVGVIDNDSICCSPFTQTIVSYNTDFVDAIVTNFDFRITLHIKAGAPTANGVILARYRITCANGTYDEADIIGNVIGSGSSCLAPANLIITNITDTTVSISWDEPVGAASYDWILYLLSNLLSPVQTGSASTIDDSITITGLTPGTQYRFYVKTLCGGSNESNLVFIDFITNPASGDVHCGHYELFNNNLAQYASVSYVDCNAITQTFFIPPFQQREICAMQLLPGQPVDITTEGSVIITYLGLC